MLKLGLGRFATKAKILQRICSQRALALTRVSVREEMYLSAAERTPHTLDADHLFDPLILMLSPSPMAANSVWTCAWRRR